ncbi:MAG: tyrosine-type recombinase/integrase [Steroidobacteraceae bacterium]
MKDEIEGLDFEAFAKAIEASPDARLVPDKEPRGREQQGSLSLIRGKWHWRYREPADASGKRRRPDRIIGTVAEFPTKAAARVEVARLRGYVLPPRLAPGSSPPWREFCARFTRIAVPVYGDGSGDQLLYTIKNHLAPAFEKLRLHEIRVPEIQAFVASQVRSGAKRATVKTRVGYLITMLRWAHDQDLAVVVPRPGAVKMPKRRDIEATPGERSYLPADEEAILTQTEDPWRTVYALLFLAGLRIGEVLALERRHLLLPPEVEPGHALIQVRQAAVKGNIAPPKSRKAVRDVPISARLAAILGQFLPTWEPTASQLLFAGPRDAPRWSSGVARHLNDFARTHGIRPPKRVFHAMRHTFSRHLHEAGIPIRVVQDLMGHGSLRAAAVYTEQSVIAHRRAAIERAAVPKVCARPIAEIEAVEPVETKPQISEELP